METKVIFIDSEKVNLFEPQLKAIAFRKIKQHIPNDFNGKPTLYDVAVERMSDGFYSVIAKVNNVKKSERYFYFSVSISRDELLAYLVDNLESGIRSANSSSWKDW